MNGRTFCYPVLCVDQERIRLDPDLVQMCRCILLLLQGLQHGDRRDVPEAFRSACSVFTSACCSADASRFCKPSIARSRKKRGGKQKFCHPEYLLRILETRKPTTRFDSYRAQYISMTENGDTKDLRRPSTSPAYVPKHVRGFRWLWWQFQPSLCRDGYSLVILQLLLEGFWGKKYHSSTI